MSADPPSLLSKFFSDYARSRSSRGSADLCGAAGTAALLFLEEPLYSIS